jgi:Bacterial dnaA protein helix-turn-helix
MDNEVITAVLSVYNISLKQLIGSSRKRHVVEARKMASLFLSKKLKQTDVANILDCDRSSISYNVKVIQDLINIYPDVAQRYNCIYKIIEPFGEVELLKLKRKEIENSLVNQPKTPSDMRFAQIKKLEEINNKINNLLKQQV